MSSSYTRGGPAMVTVGSISQDLRRALQLMVEGEKRRVWIPKRLAYQSKTDAPQGMLVFDIQLTENSSGGTAMSNTSGGAGSGTRPQRTGAGDSSRPASEGRALTFEFRGQHVGYFEAYRRVSERAGENIVTCLIAVSVISR